MPKFRIVVLGLSITSSWGNGHATTYRALIRELSARGHDVVFLERDVYWYAGNRDLPRPPYCETHLYGSVEELKDRFSGRVREADVVMVGSYVSEGVAAGEWVQSEASGVTAFYDIDTPVTMAKLDRGDFEYIHPRLIPRYDLYLSFTGGPILRRIERDYGSPRARALYCCVDASQYFPEERAAEWDLGYIGTYSADRQPAVENLLCDPASRWDQGRFVVCGPMYPKSIDWPPNVQRIDHVPPREHRRFYCSQRFTLNLTRADMMRAGYSPSVRLFEAAACGTPIISDEWPGLATIFAPGREVLISRSGDDTLRILKETAESQRAAIGAAARKRVLNAHTSVHRATEFERHVMEALAARNTTLVSTVPAPAAGRVSTP